MNEIIKKMQENIVPANNQNRSPFYSYDDHKSGKIILFIGNSITKHGPKADIGWTFNHGMAASSVENDYVHKLMNRIYEFDPEAKKVLDDMLSTADNFIVNKDLRTYYGVGSPYPMPFEYNI